jgi:surface polysaccharide O-acyltransferase-like enzyme
MNRNRTADLLKGLAVIFMIQVHLLELFATQDIYVSWIGKISLFLGGPPAAPVFMVVMGYYFASSKRTLKSGTVRGLKLILLGFY